jgi:hypothetical protein
MTPLFLGYGRAKREEEEKGGEREGRGGLRGI